ncbi:MAG: peptidoglycan-binding domain-containing protein [Actinomycetota bacterium]
MDWPEKKQGDEDPAVRTLQHLLNHHGANLNPTSAFDETTGKATIAFRESRGLPSGRTVDSAVWEALAVDLRLGDRGEAVKAAQYQLFVRGTLPGVDGIYSMKTDISVRRLQVLKRLDPDGTVDLETWQAMVSDTDFPTISEELSRDGFDWQAKLRSMLRPEI